MSNENRKNYCVISYFEFFDDYITYRYYRECTDLESIVFYSKKWVEKNGFKYGTNKGIEIYEVKNGYYNLVYDKYYD